MQSNFVILNQLGLFINFRDIRVIKISRVNYLKKISGWDFNINHFDISNAFEISVFEIS